MGRFLLAFALVLSSRLHAEEGTILRIYCEPNESRLHLTTVLDTDQAQSFHNAKTDLVNVSALITYRKDDKSGDVLRTGSNSVIRECGSLSVKISGGFFNDNPQGELGAADDYPLVEIFDGKARLTNLLAIGECDSGVGRFNYSAECPKNWATEITVFKNGSEFTVHLLHTYEEYRDGL